MHDFIIDTIRRTGKYTDQWQGVLAPLFGTKDELEAWAEMHSFTVTYRKKSSRLTMVTLRK